MTECPNSDAASAEEETTVETTGAAETRKSRFRRRGCAILILAILVVAGLAATGVSRWWTGAMAEVQIKAGRVELRYVHQRLTDHAKAHGSYPSVDPGGTNVADPPLPDRVCVAGYRADNAPPDAILAFFLRPFVNDRHMAIQVDGDISESTLDELMAALMRQSADAAKDGVTLTLTSPVKWKKPE